MADYNYSDINEAKRRVQEMKGRVKDKSSDGMKNDILSVLSSMNSQKDRALFILILYILSNETTDDAFIISILSYLL